MSVVYKFKPMDVEKLIWLVYENRCLWDKLEKNYYNRDLTRQKWDMIAAEMSASREAVKNKWRVLRDTYRKELIKFPNSTSGCEGAGLFKESSWIYFKNMEFVKDQFLKRKSEVNVPSSSQSWIKYEEDFEGDPDLKWEEVESREGSSCSAQQRYGGAQTTTTEEQERSLWQQKWSPRGGGGEDADYHFMMSLLPYLRKVPEHRKMAVRVKLQQVFCEEENYWGNASQQEH